MLRVVPLLLCAICFTAALPRSEATALLAATKKRLALQQQGQTADPVVLLRKHKDAVEVLTEQLEEAADQLQSSAVRRSEKLVEAVRTSLVPEPVDVVAAGVAKLSDLASSAMSALKAGQEQIHGLKKGLNKSPYALQVKKQETDSLAVMQQNSNIFSEILQLETHNAEFRTRTHELQSSNHMLRSEMHAMGWKLFNTVSATDDSKDPTLNVPERPKVTLKQKLDQDEDAPKEFTKATSVDFQARHDKWRASFKAWFQAKNAAASAPKALMALQKALAEKRGESQAEMQQLQKPLADLAATHLELTGRIDGIAQLMKDLGHLADITFSGSRS